MTLFYAMVPNRLKPGTFYARVVRRRRVTLDDMVPNVTSQASLSESDIYSVVKGLKDAIIEELLDGNIVVVDGLVSMKITLRGAHDSRDGALDENNTTAYIHITAEEEINGPVQQRIKYTRQKVQPRVPVIFEFVDVATGQPNVYSAGSVVSLHGDNLKFDPEDEEQGVFIQNGDGETRLVTYSRNHPTRIDAVIPAGTSGPLTVTLRTRNGGSTLHKAEYDSEVTAA